MRTYSELCSNPTFDDRLEYCKLNGVVSEETFGFDRYLNQNFYKSTEWKRVRNQVIARDMGCDLGDRDRPIVGQILVHHLNPINPNDIKDSTDYLLNPEYLICVSKETHNRIHYGIESPEDKFICTERKPNDTCPWKK